MSIERKVPINYSSRDFNTIRRDLEEYAKRYYPDTIKDFNEASFGSFVLDTVSYVGDILSFYLDYQANESFQDSAIEYNNVLRHASNKGFKFSGSPSSSGIATFYVIVPAATLGLGPDPRYIPTLKRGTELASDAGNGFLLTEDVKFAESNNEVVVAKVNTSSGLPTYYAIKAKGRVISGEIFEETISVGEFQKFLRLQLAGNNVTEMISVFDSEGHEYVEVDYLSQNVVYKSVENRNSDRNSVPNILKPFSVPRRYVLERDKGKVYMQFGFGSEEEIKAGSVVDPSNVIMNFHGRSYETDDTFDPNRLIKTDKMGIVPSNTILTIRYRSNTTNSANASVGSLSEVVAPVFEFENRNLLNESTMADVIQSLEVTNEKPIVGDISLPSTEEIKRRTKDHVAAQNRAVTIQDYQTMIYKMPSKYGAVKRARVVQDKDSFKRNLNIYVISEDREGKLTSTTSTIKENLKTWLINYKMINDTVDILDAKIVNIGIEFEVVGQMEKNKFDILQAAKEILKQEYETAMDIGQSFSISRVYQVLNKVEEVVDAVSVKIVSKIGSDYSSTFFDLEQNTSPDGRIISIPENCVFEIKYPDIDIKGTIR